MELNKNAISPYTCLYYTEDCKRNPICKYYKYESKDYWRIDPYCTLTSKGCWGCPHYISEKNAYEVIKEYQYKCSDDDNDDCMGAP